TADNRFTLGEGTKAIFERLTQPLTVTYYVDEQLPAKRVNLERDVFDKLKELQVSSNGKMNVIVERISEADARDKQVDFEEKGIFLSTDVETRGNDTSSKMKGVSEYYSSLEVRYGGSLPFVINGVVNLANKFDEFAEHRVDTLEFDIAYALLRMKNQVAKVKSRTLIQTLTEDIQFHVVLSDQMPVANKNLGNTITAAVQELKNLGGDNVIVGRHEIDYGQAGGSLAGIPLQYFQQPGVVTPPPEDKEQAQFFLAMMFIASPTAGIRDPIQFKDETDVDSVLAKLDDILWEMLRPKNRVGVISPPVAPPSQFNPEGGRDPYGLLTGYLQQSLGYDVAKIDWNTTSSIPKDVSLLLVFESNKLTERQLFEVEQYLLQGGDVMMFHQSWSMQPYMKRRSDRITLMKEPVNDHVRDWAKHLGVTFSDDLLMQKDGTLKPFTADRRTGPQVIYSDVSFAVLARQEHFSKESVFARGLTDMPLPLAVRMELDATKADSAGLKVDRLVSIPPQDMYKLIPDNPGFPQVSLLWSFDDTTDQRDKNNPDTILHHAVVQPDPDADPDEHIRLQALKDPALLGLTLTGTFNGYWAGRNKVVPNWGDNRQDPYSGKPVPSVETKPGKLTIVTSAGTLNENYLSALQASDKQAMAAYINNGLRFFRNFMDASIYGEELVGLRARSGIAPRIRSVESSEKTVWYIVCLGGTPLALALAALLLNFIRSNRRREYEAALGILTEAGK
ncbi:Gldg family protein, partial [Planctomycetota bacterium]|nr:Gldg family protein [Planctomycetota bacterium]